MGEEEKDEEEEGEEEEEEEKKERNEKEEEDREEKQRKGPGRRRRANPCSTPPGDATLENTQHGQDWSMWEDRGVRIGRHRVLMIRDSQAGLERGNFQDQSLECG